MSSLLADLIGAAIITGASTTSDGTKRGKKAALSASLVAFGIMAGVLVVTWYVGEQNIDAKKSAKLQQMVQVSEAYQLDKSLEAIKQAKLDGVISNAEYDKIKRNYTQESFDKNYELKQKSLAQKNS